MMKRQIKNRASEVNRPIKRLKAASLEPVFTPLWHGDPSRCHAFEKALQHFLPAVIASVVSKFAQEVTVPLSLLSLSSPSSLSLLSLLCLSLLSLLCLSLLSLSLYICIYRAWVVFSVLLLWVVGSSLLHAYDRILFSCLTRFRACVTWSFP